MAKSKRTTKVSTKLNIMFLMSLVVITGIQTWLRNNTNQQIAFILSIFITLLAFGVLWLFTHRVVARSLSRLLLIAERWKSGDLTAQTKLNTADEFQQLGDTFNQLSNELNHTLKGLEKTVAERTLILQRRARQLQAAADVGRIAVTIRDLDILLPEVTRLISIRFDVYHAGIFLIDEVEDYAVLKASNSEGGKRMLQEQYRLKVGTQGLVGHVASNGEPRISLDVGTDTIHHKNPHLPETQSEIALPLGVGGVILGVLDVQSTRPAAFTEEDASILQIMADQVATAIDNARLLAENRKALEVSRRAYGELSREVWGKYLQTRPDIGFIVTGENPTIRAAKTRGLSEYPAHEESDLVEQGGELTVAVPIRLRDHIIGAFRLQKKDGTGKWSEDEIDLMQSIADQVSIALEASRLFDDSQRRADRERLAGEITARMRATNDPQEILQVAVRELRNALNASQAQVLLTDTLEKGKTPYMRNNGSRAGVDTEAVDQDV
jgi:GAF domain-containing protein